MNYPAASYGVSKMARNEASFGEYDPKRFNTPLFESEGRVKKTRLSNLYFVRFFSNLFFHPST